MQPHQYLGTKAWQIGKWIGFLIVYLFASGLLEVAGEYTHNPFLTRHLLGIALVVTAAALSLIAWRYGKQLQASNPRRFGKTGLTRKRVAEFIVVFLLMLAFQMLWSYLIAKHILMTPDNQKAVEADQLRLPVWNAIFSVVLAPIFEELIFRGIFMNYFFNKDNRLNNLLAIIASGLLFGFAHELQFNVNWLMYSGLGCFLSFTYMHFRDIRYSIGLHFLNNFISMI
ncbi:CPBP family intramembrane glutamic endopeptidase [Lentilactobacillus raoultii]|uniref:CPBP family intramembrane glutamic endopeptidase n=1 Tax=Lentilactobacillus raoultii TaxID=1987503 RepID=A0ABW3PKF2_9LACO|nr:type II CAAX endopeptidase family protein [Lentilactobacillus raoultii]